MQRVETSPVLLNRRCHDGAVLPFGDGPGSRRQTLAVWAMCGWTLVLLGCGAGSETSGPPPSTPVVENVVWTVLELRQTRVGHARLAWRRVSEAGVELIETEHVVSMSVDRGSQSTAITVNSTTWETLDQRLVRFRNVVRQADQPVVTTGEMRSGALTLVEQSAGRTTQRTIPITGDLRSALAWQHWLRAKPPVVGATERWKSFEPALGQIVDESISAEAWELTDVLGEQRRLLRVRRVIAPSAGSSLSATAWADERGEIWKTQMDQMGLVESRATEAIAKASVGGVRLDLLFDTMIPLDRPLANPQTTRQVVYRVQLQNVDPATVFVSDRTQSIRAIDAKTAEITVRAVTPDTPSAHAGESNVALPTDDDRRPNSRVESDAAKVVEMARAAAGGETDPWRMAVALERHVHRSMRMTYDQPFASAAQVAATLSGDCSEYAVLLAALARAKGIPSRVAAGLVYVPARQSLAYHMWTEVWIAERWIPLDATVGRGSVGCDRLKVSVTNLAHGAVDATLLKLLESRPAIHVVSATYP